MNKTNIPPKNTRKRIYENQNLLVIKPEVKQTSVVWISKVNPIAKGCFIFIKIKLKINNRDSKIHCIISRGSLSKILILGINDKEFSFLLKF